MDTLAKETMGLPIFICPTNHQIISSGSTANTISTTTTATSPTTTTPTSTTTSPTTSFFATAKSTRCSPTTPTFPSASTSFLPTTCTTNVPAQSHQRRNTYTPPTFSPPSRRESLLSTHRLSQAFDFASSLAVGVLTKAADSVFGEGQQQQDTQQDIWGDEDLESGDRQREKERREKARFARFGDEEGGFEGWLD